MTVTVKVTKQDEGRPDHAIFTNGKSDGSLIGDYPTMALVALLPCMIVDSCTDAFVIGFETTEQIDQMVKRIETALKR